MIVNNRFIEFYMMLKAFIPTEIIIIFLTGLIYYIITILKGDNNAKKGHK